MKDNRYVFVLPLGRTVVGKIRGAAIWNNVPKEIKEQMRSKRWIANLK